MHDQQRRFSNDEVEEIFGRDPAEIRRWLEERAAAARPEVERAIQSLFDQAPGVTRPH